MWACVGIAPSAFLAWIGWAAAYSQLPSTAQLQFAWIGPAMFVSGVASVVVGSLALLMDLSVRRDEKRSVKQLLEYMDDMYEPHKAALEGLPQGQIAPGSPPGTA